PTSFNSARSPVNATQRRTDSDPNGWCGPAHGAWASDLPAECRNHTADQARLNHSLAGREALQLLPRIPHGHHEDRAGPSFSALPAVYDLRVGRTQMSNSDAQRFKALVDPHLDALFRAAFRLARNEADAQDLVQETCIRAYQRIPEFHE